MTFLLIFEEAMTEEVAMLYFPLSSCRSSSCGCMGSVVGMVAFKLPTRCLLFDLISVGDDSVLGTSISEIDLFAPPPLPPPPLSVLGDVLFDEAAAECIVTIRLILSGQVEVNRRAIRWSNRRWVTVINAVGGESRQPAWLRWLAGLRLRLSSELYESLPKYCSNVRVRGASPPPSARELHPGKIAYR